MVINEKELKQIKASFECYQLSQQKLELMMLQLFDKYQVLKSEYSLNLGTGEFVKTNAVETPK